VLRGDAVGQAAAVNFERPSGGRLDQIVGLHRGPFGRWIVLSRRVDVVLRYDRNRRFLDYSPSTLERPVDLAPVGVGAAQRRQDDRVHLLGPELAQVVLPEQDGPAGASPPERRRDPPVHVQPAG